jgi:hypothetical protein
MYTTDYILCMNEAVAKHKLFNNLKFFEFSGFQRKMVFKFFNIKKIKRLTLVMRFLN